jgi:GTP-binding protein LepA
MQNIRNFCIIAHIDHGKSTLADRLLELTGTVEKRKMHEQFLDQMDLERERGITIKLQPVRMRYKLGGEDYILNLIDTPGHVDFSYEVSRSLVAVEGAILLVDAAKGVQAQTLANFHLAQKQGLVIIPVINKIDLPNAKIEMVEEELIKLTNKSRSDILKISAKTGEGITEVLKAIINLIPAPTLGETKKERALIFDSVFDAYRGVIAYVRIFGGGFKAGDKIKLLAGKVASEIIEVGFFQPQLKETAKISEGEIGYIATGLKTPGQVRVGDTIALASAESEPLSGYKEPKPMVFASFFPENSDDYDLLNDALAKLKLTDASLAYESESSPALGRGFRLGFLGLLHAEIITERLRREYRLSLIISSPSVEYRVSRKDGKVLQIRSASILPDAAVIERIEEPVIILEILSPASYLGTLLKLLSNLRSQYLSTDYLTKEIIILKYQAPLAEIVTDFYDNLKSVSSGYASMSYEPAGYVESDLVRLDFLVAGDLVEPFSKLVPREKAYDEGKKTVERLKRLIPKQLFVVSLQAAIGGKIIAREDIGAMRKDVTGYLYGGDVTRKKKLLEKQKRGKARMKEFGRVEIPHQVFLEMLRK